MTRATTSGRVGRSPSPREPRTPLRCSARGDLPRREPDRRHGTLPRRPRRVGTARPAGRRRGRADPAGAWSSRRDPGWARGCPVTVVIWIFALLAAAIHIVVFVFEALLIQRPGIHWGVFKVPSRDVPAIRLWAFGVGFYNLFLGIGMVAGVI